MWEERHRRLVARLALAGMASAVVWFVGTLLVWWTETDAPGGAIHGLGDAAFFTAVQLLTISSQLPNPVTSAGRCVDIGLEVWGLFVVAGVAGSFASFFGAADPDESGQA